MLNVEHLMRIKNIPRGIEQQQLLYFLRQLWMKVENEDDSIFVAVDENTTPINFFLKRWYLEDGEFIIRDVGKFRDNFVLDCFGYGTTILAGGLRLIPDILDATFDQPMILYVDSYKIAPHDIDQIDIFNSLITCRKLGDFQNKNVQQRGFAGFYISTNDENTMVIYQSSLDASDDEIIWIIPVAKEKEWMW